MKKIILSAAVAVAALALTSESAMAAPLCSNVVDVTTLNAGGGCTVGAYTFNNFQVSVGGTVGIVSVNNPGTGGIGLNFNPNLTNAAVLNDIHFLFSVTGPANGLGSVYLFNGASGGVSSIGETICNSLGVNLSGACTSGSSLTSLSASQQSSSTATFAPQTTIWVWKDLNIAPNSATHLSSFDQNFSSTAVPEPATLSLMGLGLVGLGLVARRKKS